MAEDKIISELYESNNNMYKYKCDIKKFAIITLIIALVATYYLVFDNSDTFGFMVIFLLAAGGFLLHTCQLIGKKNKEEQNLNLLCLKLYGKNYNSSQQEINKTILEYIRKS